MSTDDLVPIGKAGKLFPGNPHVTTLNRWVVHGIRGIKLRTVRVGAKRYLNAKLVAEFIERTSREVASCS